MWIVHVYVTNRCPLSVCQLVQCRFEVVEIGNRHARHFQNHSTTRNCGFGEQVAGICNIHALCLAVVMARLLIRQPVDYCIAKFDVFIRRNRVQVIDANSVHDRFATAFHFDFNVTAHVAVKHRLEWHEFGDQFTVNANEDVTGRQLAIGRRLRNNMADRQHTRLLRISKSRQALRFDCQAQSTQFVVRVALKRCL